MVRRTDRETGTYTVGWLHQLATSESGQWRHKFVPVRVGMGKDAANSLLHRLRRKGWDVVLINY